MTNDTQENADRIVIRKYANRRLYNTQTGEFVTLDALREMVRGGLDFQVVDAKSDQDITSSVLAQIIAEQEGRGESMLPDDILRQIITFYDQGLTENYASFLRQSMQAFNENANQFESLSKAGMKNIEMFQKSMAALFGMPVSSAPETPKEPAEDDRAELDALRAEMKRMQERLDRLTKDD